MDSPSIDDLLSSLFDSLILLDFFEPNYYLLFYYCSYSSSNPPSLSTFLLDPEEFNIPHLF